MTEPDLRNSFVSAMFSMSLSVCQPLFESLSEVELPFTGRMKWGMHLDAWAKSPMNYGLKGMPCRIHSVFRMYGFAALLKFILQVSQCRVCPCKLFKNCRSCYLLFRNLMNISDPCAFWVHQKFMFTRVPDDPDVIRMSIWTLTKVVEKLEEQEWKVNPVASGSQQTMTTGCSLWAPGCSLG